MKAFILGCMITLIGVQPLFAQNLSEEEEIIELSKEKWQWMSDKNTEVLSTLFHEKSVFVHMGGAWGKQEEINVIKSGNIWYKKADIHEVSVNIVDNTAILVCLERIEFLWRKGSGSGRIICRKEVGF